MVKESSYSTGTAAAAGRGWLCCWQVDGMNIVAVLLLVLLQASWVTGQQALSTARYPKVLDALHGS
jgi:hypothetical protein